jgi:hypothetical protein
MTSNFNNSIIGKAEYDGFVSNTAQESSGWCLNCCFKIMKKTKKKKKPFKQPLRKCPKNTKVRKDGMAKSNTSI